MLLDTHVWLWLVLGTPHKLSAGLQRRLERAAAARQLCVSSASMFEVSTLALRGVFVPSRPLEQWIDDAIQASLVRVTDVGLGVAVDAGAVPASALADPMDRLIVAAARHLELPLVTADARIVDYASTTRRVTVVDARH